MSARVLPNYKGLEGLVKDIVPDIRKDLKELKDVYNLQPKDFEVIQYNIELLLDRFADVTGTPNTNHKVIGSQWAYLTDIYLGSLLDDFDAACNEYLNDNIPRDNVYFNIDYISKDEAKLMIDYISKTYLSFLEVTHRKV